MMNIVRNIIDLHSYKDLVDNYNKLEKDSFDYAVLERASSVAVVPYSGEWKDLGTWNTITEVMEPSYGFAVSSEECTNTNVINELEIPIVVMGAHDMIIAASPDGILMMYIGIANKGNVIFNRVSDNQVAPVYFNGMVEDINIYVSSKSWCCGNTAEIIINGENYSLNSRGLNIVIYDFESKKVVDSSTYDAHLPKAPFYHRYLEMDNAYLDSRLFVPEKYIEIWRNVFRIRYFSNRKLNVQEVENGVVLPVKVVNGKKCGGACDENFEFISGYDNFSHESYKNNRCVLDGYIPEEGEVQYIDETVMYGGVIFDPVGHLILETIARQLWYLTDNKDPQLKVAVVMVNWVQWGKSFFRETMEAFGFPQGRIIVVSSPTKFKKLLIPDVSESIYFGCLPYEFTREFSLFFEHIRNNVTPAKYKKYILPKPKLQEKISSVNNILLNSTENTDLK